MKSLLLAAAHTSAPSRNRSLRGGLLLSASAGMALSHAAPARAQSAVRVAPNTARQTLRLAKSQEAAGSLALAAVSYRLAASQAPSDVSLARELARFYGRGDRIGEENIAWLRVSQLRRGDAEAARELARLRPLVAKLPASELQSAGVGNEAPLPFGQGLSPRVRSGARLVNGNTGLKSMTLPPVGAPPVETRAATLVRVPSSELPNLPDALGMPAPSASVPTPDTSTSETPASNSAPSASPSEASASPSGAAPTDAAGAASAPTSPASPSVGAPEAQTEPPAITPSAPSAGAPPADNLPSAPESGDATPSVAVEAPTSPTTSAPTFRPASPTLAPIPPSTRVSSVPFVAPTRVFDRVSKVTAARAWPYVNRGAALLTQKNTQGALAQYERAAAIDQNNAYALPGVATSQIILGRFDEAAQTYRRFLALKPNDPKGLRGLADALTFGRHYREALGVNNYILATRNANDFPSAYQNGQIYTFLRSYDAADAAFARALTLQPQNVGALVARGESLSYRRDPRAIASFQKALQLSPGNPRATLGLGNFYLYTGQFGQAIPRLQEVSRAQPKNVGALVSLGDALSFNNKPIDAIGPYARALNLAPSNIPARVGFGRALVFSGRTAEGNAQLQQVLSAEPNNVGALEAVALVQSKTNPTASIATYRRLISAQRDPATRARLFASLGDVQLGQNEVAGASASYAQAEQLAPSDARIVLTHAQLLSYQSKWPATAQAARRALALMPNNPQAQALLLQASLKTGDTATASQLSRQLENATPQTAQESLDLAQALRDAGNPEAANRLLQRAVSQSANVATQVRIADATRDAGDYTNAGAIYGRVLQAQPNNFQARLGLIRTRLYARDLSGAQSQVDALLAQSPQSVPGRILAAQIQLRGDTPASRDEAARIANSVLTTDPSNADARAILGQVLTTRQRFAEAVTQFQAAVAANPNNLEARLGLARNLNYSRDIEGSITQYRELITRAPADALPRLELAQILLDRSRYSEAEALFNEVLVLRRGSALLPSVRRAIASNSLERLSPLSRDSSPLFFRVLAELKPRVRLAQNTAASGPTLPSAGGSLGTNAGTPGVLGSGQGAPVASGGTSSGSATAPSSSAPAPLTNAAGGDASTAPSLPAVPAASGEAAAPAALDVPAPNATGPVAPTTGTPSVDEPLATAASDQGAALRGLGESRRRQNRFSEALTFFSQALTLNPNDVAARVGLAQSLRGQNQFATAQQQVAAALTLDPANIPARVLSAQLLADTGQTDAANTQLNALVSSLPDNAPLESYTQLALALNSVSNYPASLALLQKAVTQFPTEPSVARLRAETLGFAGQPDAAVAAYDALIAADANDTDARLGRARVFNYANRLPEAQTAYRVVLTAQPSNFAAQTELADVLGRAGNYSEGITLYSQAIGENPSDLSARIGLARLQRAANQFADAESTLNQVIEADPNNAPALIERGSLRGSQGQTAAGLSDLQRAISLSPNDQSAQLGLAQVYSYSGQYPQSLAAYQAFLARNPKSTVARTEYAQVLSYSNRSPEALTQLATVLAQSPTDRNALLTRADILSRSGRTGDAVTQYNAILASDPTNIRARQGLADAYLYGRRYNDAIRVYNGLIAARPNDVGLKISRARALGYAGRARESVASLRQIVAADPTNTTARLALAEAGANSGNATLQRDAIGEYRSILSSAPDNLPAELGLARVLSYRGKYSQAKTILNRILATNPANTDARLALADTESFAGQPFDAKRNYQLAAASGASAAAKRGLNSIYKQTAPSIGFGGTYYHDSNGINLHSLDENAFLRTKLLTIGVLASEGNFRQRNGLNRRRNDYGFLLARNFGPFTAQAIISRLKYTGVKEKTLYNVLLGRDFTPRTRFSLDFARRDIFESDLAVGRNIYADTSEAFVALPVGSRLDLETRATYYNYSDGNSRVTASPSLFFRFSPTNPTFRVGAGYTYDNTRQTRNDPFVYYTPQNFNAASVLADYVVTQSATRYGFNASYPITTTTGRSGLNRPAATAFGFLERDLSRNFDVFLNGGIVRVPNGSFKSEQASAGVNLRF